MRRIWVQRITWMLLLVLLLIPGSRRIKAEEQTMAEKYAAYELYDVTKYGADNSGGKNSANAFLAAISDAGEGEKGIVYVPAGTYKIASALQIRQQVTIAAEKGAVIQGTCNNVFSIRTDNVTFDGGTWSGSQNQSQILIQVYQAKDFSLNNAVVRNTGIGIHFNQASGTLDSDNFTKCKDRAVRIVGKSAVTVRNSTVTSNGSAYYSKKKAGDMGHGISANESTLNVENSNITSNTQCGISLVKAKATVKKCTLKNNGRHGIGTYGVCTLNVKDTTITHNGYDTKEQKNGHNGVILVDGSKGTFTNCTISRNKNTGVWVAGKGAKAEFKKVVFEKNKLIQLNITGYNGKVTVILNNCTMKKASLGIMATGKYKITRKGKLKFSGIKKRCWYM